jgi:glucose-1-phosphate thymidylyltransferase
VLGIAEFKQPKAALGIAGAYLLGPGQLHRAAQHGWLAGARLDASAAADNLAVDGHRVDVELVSGWRRYAGKLNDLLELNRMMLDALTGSWDLAVAEESQIEGRVTIHATARIVSSTIVGPAIIGAGARIANAYVGPYTAVGAQARIEGVEIERSIISPGACISHVGGRLVSSVVGANARIFRDFSLPRAIRLRVGEDVEVALS